MTTETEVKESVPHTYRSYFADWVTTLSEACESVWKGDSVGFNQSMREAVEQYLEFMAENTRLHGLAVYDAPNLLLKEHIEDHWNITPGSHDRLIEEAVRTFRRSAKIKMIETVPGLKRFDHVEDPVYFGAIYNYARPSDLVINGEIRPFHFLKDRIASASKTRLNEAREKALEASILFYKNQGMRFGNELQVLVDEEALLSLKKRAVTLHL